MGSRQGADHKFFISGSKLGRCGDRSLPNIERGRAFEVVGRMELEETERRDRSVVVCEVGSGRR